MVRPVITFVAEQSIKINASLELMEIEPGLYAYRQTIKSSPEGRTPGSTMDMPSIALTKSTKEGLIDEAGRASMLSGNAPEKLNLVPLSQEQIQGFQTRGWSPMEEEIYEDYPKNHWQIMENNPHFTADNLVTLDASNHMVLDRHGEPLPVAIVFDYISSHISESSHDLRKLSEHLLTRPDVVVYHKERRQLKQAFTVDDAIFQIPGYNANEGCTLSVQFLWKPSREEYLKVCKKHNGKHSNLGQNSKVFDLDLLDIKQFEIQSAPRSKKSHAP